MEKNNKGLLIVTIVLLVLVLALGGYLIYDKVLSDEEGKVDNGGTNEPTDSEVELTNSELEEYLSYVPMKPEDTDKISYGYDTCAYSGNLETVNTLNEKLLMAKAFNLSEKANTTESYDFSWCGDVTPCEGFQYVTIEEFNDTINKMYNIKSVSSTKFITSGGSVEKANNHYVSHIGRGSLNYSKINEIVKYEIEDNDLVIYERAAFVTGDVYDAKLSKTTNDNYIVKTYDVATTSNYMEDAQAYFESNKSEFYVFKHTFKLNENNTYYWYSSEVDK